jgi:hypothetical protein
VLNFASLLLEVKNVEAVFEKSVVRAVLGPERQQVTGKK